MWVGGPGTWGLNQNDALLSEGRSSLSGPTIPACQGHRRTFGATVPDLDLPAQRLVPESGVRARKGTQHFC